MFVLCMELRQLEHVLAVFETGTLTGAATRVGLTQQALSKSLYRLEESLGGKLFEREARGMSPTRLGDTVAEHAREVVASAGRLQSAASAEIGLERGKLVIGLSPIAATTAIGHRVVKFAQAHPNLRIDVEAGIDREFVAALHRGEIDLALSSQIGGEQDSILVEQIGSEPWGVAGRCDHPLLSAAKTLKDIETSQWILGRNTDLLREDIEDSFAKANAFAPQPGIMTTSVLFALSALKKSEHLSILPRSLCATMPELLWRDFADRQWSSPLYLMRRKQAHLGLAVRGLIAELRGD